MTTRTSTLTLTLFLLGATTALPALSQTKIPYGPDPMQYGELTLPEGDGPPTENNAFTMEDIELTKDDENRHIMVMSVSIGAEARLWRLPIVSTPAITEGKVLIGSFGVGATLYDRMEGTIRVAEQHSDFFVRNAVAVLAEERIALAVKRPESFVEVTLNNAPVAP